jgi:hypothetical protein
MLEKAIDQLATGDVLVVAEWDQATRSMIDAVGIIERFNRRGRLINVLDKPHLDLTTPLGRRFIAFLSAMAEDERQRIVSRANDGRKAAKAKCVRFGRKTQADRALACGSPAAGSTPARAHAPSPSRCLQCCFGVCRVEVHVKDAHRKPQHYCPVRVSQLLHWPSFLKT